MNKLKISKVKMNNHLTIMSTMNPVMRASTAVIGTISLL